MANYNLLINKDQDITLDEIDLILKKISKQYREYLYMNREYIESINKDGFYVFLESISESELWDCNQKLKQQGYQLILNQMMSYIHYHILKKMKNMMQELYI